MQQTTTLPARLEQHRDWLDFQERLAQLEEAAEVTSQELDRLKMRRAECIATRDEADVAAALGEDAAATSRAANAAQQIAEIDREIEDLSRRHVAQVEAARRYSAREAELRSRLAVTVRADVLRAHRRLTEELAKKLEALSPVMDALIDLRGQHPIASEGLPFLDVLRPAVAPESGLANQVEIWLRGVRALGIDCDLGR